MRGRADDLLTHWLDAGAARYRIVPAPTAPRALVSPDMPLPSITFPNELLNIILAYTDWVVTEWTVVSSLAESKTESKAGTKPTMVRLIQTRESANARNFGANDSSVHLVTQEPNTAATLSRWARLDVERQSEQLLLRMRSGQLLPFLSH